MIRYKPCDCLAEIEQIVQLQQENLPDNLSLEEREKEGFVTVVHSLELLQAMNKKWSHTLALVNGKVVGYALSMHPDFGRDIEVLLPMFQQLEIIRPNTSKYMVMGQICIAKPFRGKGIFRGLYQAMQKNLSTQFTEIITEIDANNQRSLNAHLTVGFAKILSYRTDTREWVLVSLKK